MTLYLLLETHSGFSLFHAHGLPSVGHDKDAVLASLLSFPAFSDLVRLVSFLPFPSPADALRLRKAIVEGFMSDELKKFLEDNLPKVGDGEKPSYSVGVADARMGYRIAREFQILCKTDDFVLELLLGICIYFHSFIDNAESTSAETAELRLGCSRMRAKVRLDSLIVHASSRSRTLAEEIVSLSEMIRERYSWHFPELGNVVKNHYLYAKVAKLVENRSEFSQDRILKLGEILGDEQTAHQIFEAAKDSKGLDLSTVDLINIQKFGQRVEDLSEYMKKLSVYLVTEMNDIAPNLTFLIGEIAAVQLISRAGSLLNLAKLPSSSLQILAARARGMRGKPRKFNFPSLFDQAFASGKCRYLANKCSVAARIDCFSEANELAPGPIQFVKNQAGVKMYREVAQTIKEAVSQVAVAQNVLINGDQLQDGVNRMDTRMDVQLQVVSEDFVPLCKTSSSPISSSLRSSASLGKEPNIKSPFRDFRLKKKRKCSSASDNSDQWLTGVIRCFIGGAASIQEEEKGTDDGVTSSQVEERGTGEGVTTSQAVERETYEGVASSQVEGRETGVGVITSQTAERGPCEGVTTSQVAERGTGECVTTSQAAEMGTGGGVTTSQVVERGIGESVTSSQEAGRGSCEGVASQAAREGNQGGLA